MLRDEGVTVRRVASMVPVAVFVIARFVAPMSKAEPSRFASTCTIPDAMRGIELVMGRVVQRGQVTPATNKRALSGSATRGQAYRPARVPGRHSAQPRLCEAERLQRLFCLRHGDDALELRTSHGGRRYCDVRLKSRRIARIARIARERDRSRRRRGRLIHIGDRELRRRARDLELAFMKGAMVGRNTRRRDLDLFAHEMLAPRLATRSPSKPKRSIRAIRP